MELKLKWKESEGPDAEAEHVPEATALRRDWRQRVKRWSAVRMEKTQEEAKETTTGPRSSQMDRGKREPARGRWRRGKGCGSVDLWLCGSVAVALFALFGDGIGLKV